MHISASTKPMTESLRLLLKAVRQGYAEAAAKAEGEVGNHLGNIKTLADTIKTNLAEVCCLLLCRFFCKHCTLALPL